MNPLDYNFNTTTIATTNNIISPHNISTSPTNFTTINNNPHNYSNSNPNLNINYNLYNENYCVNNKNNNNNKDSLNSNPNKNLNFNRNQVIVERRGAPYSHNVFKSTMIPNFISHGKSDISFISNQQRLPKNSVFRSNESIKATTPLNRANAILGGFLTEYYSTLPTNLNMSTSSSSSHGSTSSSSSSSKFSSYAPSSTPLTTSFQSSALYENDTQALRYSCEKIFPNKTNIESDRISPTSSLSSSSTISNDPHNSIYSD